MGVSGLVKRGLAQAFVLFTTLAVLLNVVAAAMSMKRDLWAIAGGYLLIACALASAVVIHWYTRHRQAPYRWRDEEWGLERWREGARGEERADEDPDEYDDPWRDDRD